jgi:hypothetical protein
VRESPGATFGSQSHLFNFPQLAGHRKLSPGRVWLGLFPFCLRYFRPMPRTFLYRCPNTGRNVQGWSADEVTDDDETYQSFECIACTSVHLVNLKTGKVLGEDED